MNQCATTLTASDSSLDGVENVLPTDSFAAGMTSLIALSAVQKVVGLLRTILFCWLLSPDELGRWALGLAFLFTAAPFTVLGLPGTYGKYVEYFRQRGQLRAFLRQTLGVCSLLTLIVVGGMLAAPAQLSQLVFRDPNQLPLTFALIAVLAVTIVWNTLNELLTSLRMIRMAALLQFVSAISFTVLGVVLTAATDWNELGLVVGFGAASLLASLGALWVLAPLWTSVNGADLRLSTHDVLRKLLPYAAGIWVSNMLTNGLHQSSQYMIKWFSSDDPSQGDELVGQFFSSRAVPMIMLTVAAYFSGVLLPYLSHDWEKGRREAIADRLNLTLKVVAIFYSAASALVLLGAPLLFGWALGHRYDAGLALVPWTLAYFAWASLISIAQNYLWCVEKAWMGNIALAVALIANVTLGWLLIPTCGLLGAVWAIAVGQAVALLMIYWFNWRLGYRINGGVLLATAIPLALGLGENLGGLTALLLAGAACYSNLLLNPEEKRTVLDALRTGWKKVAGRFAGPPNASADH